MRTQTLSLWLVSSLLLVQPVVRADFHRPPDPWPGPTNAFFFVEAEDFDTLEPGWARIETRSDRHGHRVASRNAALSGSDAGQGVARHTLRITEAGLYHLVIRYTDWPADVSDHPHRDHYHAPFRFRMTQAGDTVHDHVYATGTTEPDAPKRANFSRFQEAHATVQLNAGDVILELSKEGEARVHNTLRWIDCIFLTQDASYTFDYLDFNPQLYLRIRLQDVEPDSVYFYCFVNHTRMPWFKNVTMGRQGWRRGVFGARDQHYMSAGEETVWMNITRLTYVDADTLFKLRATVAYGNPDAAHSSYTLDFASAPTDEAILKSLTRSGPGPGMFVRVPGVITPDTLPKADYEYAEERLDMLGRLPRITFGRQPHLFPTIIQIPGNRESISAGVRAAELQAAAYLGINGVWGLPSDEDAEAGVRFGSSYAGIMQRGPAGYNEPLLDKIEQAVARSAASLRESGHASSIVFTMLADEAAAQGLERMSAHPLNHETFVAWLREQGDDAAVVDDEGRLADGTPVRLVTERDDHPVLYFHSQRFRAWSIANFFKTASDRVRTHFPEPANQTTMQTFSDGAVYMANMYMQGNDYFTWFKNKSLDIAFGEDWTNVGATHQLCGWNVALLRAATRYHGQPIKMFVITSYGRTPLAVKLKAYTNLSEGAKAFIFFAFAPRYAGHERGWAERPEMYPAIAELTREIGAAEHVLMDALPRRAETAILYSIPYDIWGVGHDNTHGHARMFTYLALRHDQIPVDIITDEDVREGDLTGRKLVYLFGEQIDERAIPALGNWVQGGGMLVLAPGAGTRDRFNAETDALDRALGIRREPAEHLASLYDHSQGVCNRLKSFGDVRLNADETLGPLLAWRQPLPALDGMTPEAYLDSGDPAAVTLPSGDGRVRLVGFMPALAYMQAAWQDYRQHQDAPVEPLRVVASAIEATQPEGTDLATAEAHLLTVPRRRSIAFPTAYPHALRAFITAPAQQAGVARPVRLDQPMVEATWLEGETGWVIPLANYSGTPIDQLEVNIETGRPHGPIHSSRLGRIKDRKTPNGRRAVVVPLESTDMLWAEWK